MTTTSTPTEALTNLMCSFFIFFILVVYIIQSQFFQRHIFLHIVVEAFFSFNAAINTFGRFIAKGLC